MKWDVGDQICELEKLLAPGIIGLYHSVEVTEVFAFSAKQPPINVFTLLVAEQLEANSVEMSTPRFLNSKPLPLKGSQWKLGVGRYRLSIPSLIGKLREFEKDGQWKLSGNVLSTGRLKAFPSQFVPSDSVESHAWNGVLKNNFWEGAYVLELVDPDKHGVGFLLSNSSLLAELSTLIYPYVKIGLDGLSDRLGNIAIQLPVTALSTRARGSDAGDYSLQVAWHPAIQPRSLRVSCEVYEDFTVEAYASQAFNGSSITLPIKTKTGRARHVIWDDVNKIIVGASSKVAFVNSFSFRTHVAGAVDSRNQRIFEVVRADGEVIVETVALHQEHPSNVIGSPSSDPREPWRADRVYRQSLPALERNREFIQYGGNTDNDAERALSDIRWLIEKHGKMGVWLWDPYLTSNDIINTLLYCPFQDADLRGLSAAKAVHDDTKKIVGKPKGMGMLEVLSLLAKKVILQMERQKYFSFAASWARKFRVKGKQKNNWKSHQVERLEKSILKRESITLEFRVRQNGVSWGFHDRFLIFPQPNGSALAWSLGTSVNSLGHQHHILQKVSDGERIRRAYIELWDKLSSETCVVWKSR